MLKNPILGKNPPNCRCADCFNSFWFKENGGDGLQCICQISHSKTYITKGLIHKAKPINAIRNEWITKCEGTAVDDMKKERKKAKYTACSDCDEAMWHIRKGDLKCYCRIIGVITYGKEVGRRIIKHCNGVDPIQEVEV